MRNISSNGLAKLAQRLGTEPLCIVEVDWNGKPVLYADRTIEGIPGRILEVGELDNIIDVDGGNNSQELSIVLNDTDGSIKDILDNFDIHQRPASIYQYFEGLDLADKFLLFKGKVSSPIVWSESERTVSFTVISQLEDKEFGFSAEEGQFPFIPKDMVGKPWPVIFGKVLDYPALQVNKAVSGSTLCGIGILSGAAAHIGMPLGGITGQNSTNNAMANIQRNHLLKVEFAWQGIDNAKAQQAGDQADQILAQTQSSAIQFDQQQTCALTTRQQTLTDAENNGLGCNPVRILGGEDFPQDTPIQINVNGGLFTGTMHNDEFTISSRVHPANEAQAEELAASATQTTCPTLTPNQSFDLLTEVPPPHADYTVTVTTPRKGKSPIVKLHGYIRDEGFIISTGEQTSRPNIDQVAQHFWAEPGSRVVLASDEPITYIASITPGTVLAVKAYKQFTGEKRLVNVPNDLWRVQTTVYGSITAVEVVVTKPLSTIVDQGWGDDIYITFESTVGPNTTDILRYIIDNYTDLDYDDTTFDAVETQVAAFPMNFPVLDRKNTIEVIKEIAFQARCAVWISNDTFYLKYLPAEPDSDQTITVSDIQNKSISVSLTPTEDLVTKMVVTWRLSWADGNGEEPEKIILRHNVAKYGTKEGEFYFYCFNQPDIILKAATFWLIRKSNTWKKIQFKTFLNALNLETFDTVTLDLPAYVASGDVKAVVEKANYNSDDKTIDFECWVPVKAGTMEKYQFAWPASLTVSDTFPTPADSPGGGGIGANATGDLPIGYTDGIGTGGTVFVGGPNVVFRGRADWGDRTPGDSGFGAQSVLPNNVFANLTNVTNPKPNLKVNFIDPIPAIPLPPLPDFTDIRIDIRSSVITDSFAGDDTEVAPLDSFIRFIRDGDLVLNTEAQFSEDDDKIAEFDFEYDEDTEKYGAGTVFLKDDA